MQGGTVQVFVRVKICPDPCKRGLRKPQRQRECHQTKGLMSKTIAVHVRYKSLYISLPSSAKQQRETITVLRILEMV